MAIPVVLRAERSGPFKGTITAVLPTVLATPNAAEFTTFDLNGGFSAGSIGWYRGTRAATPAEAWKVLQTLQELFEDEALIPVSRMTQGHREIREEELDRLFLN